jgi:hypothetical protein
VPGVGGTGLTRLPVQGGGPVGGERHQLQLVGRELGLEPLHPLQLDRLLPAVRACTGSTSPNDGTDVTGGPNSGSARSATVGPTPNPPPMNTPPRRAGGTTPPGR